MRYSGIGDVGVCPPKAKVIRIESGAPRSMKMGTAVSPLPYDAATCHASQSAKLRHAKILHYAARGCVPCFAGRSSYSSVAGLLDQAWNRRDMPTAVVASSQASDRLNPGSCPALRMPPYANYHGKSNPKSVTGNFMRKNRRARFSCLLFCLIY